MGNPLISVIVPVYKAEAYLEKCVGSIRNQTYSNLEIILVDDGSPDNCGRMCDAFAAEDARIRVFHKENGGQSSARNLGLDNMQGDYVAFVDSDDWIEPDMYRHLYGLIWEHDAQIACCGIRNHFLDGRVTYFNPQYPADGQIRLYTTVEALEESLRNCRITYSPCDKLYHSSVFRDVRMTVGKIYEDMEMIPKCIERAERIVYDPQPFYQYNLTGESTIRGAFNPRRFAEADVAWEKAEDYRIRYPHLYGQAMGCYIAICLNIIHLSAGVTACAQRRGELIAQLRGKLPEAAVRAMRRKDRVKLKALRLSPAVFEMLMGLYEKIK